MERTPLGDDGASICLSHGDPARIEDHGDLKLGAGLTRVAGAAGGDGGQGEAQKG